MAIIFDPSEIQKGAAIIKSGGVVAFPTETVYGLGADATNEQAVQKIFNAKGRPVQNPLIVHFKSLDDLFTRIPEMDKGTKSILCKIQDALTVIIPRPAWIPAAVSAGLDTVAVRVPSCEFSRNFIKACGVPLAAPSANTSTRPSPTRWQHVYTDLKDKIDAVFACDPVRIGVESTVVRVLNDKIQVLRLGGTNTAKLEEIMPVEIAGGKQTAASPGTQFKHYAPACRMLVAKYGEDMTRRIQRFLKSAKNVTVIFWQGNASDYLPNLYTGTNTNISGVVYLGHTVSEITHNFFSSIRTAEQGSDIIICEGFPDRKEYETLNERISRAAEGNYI